MRGAPRDNGLATIVTRSSAAIAHELFHLIGYKHGPGVMQPKIELDDALDIDDYALVYASAVRFTGKA